MLLIDPQLDAEDVPLHHVKPHGVLYGMIYRDKELCRAVYQAVPKGTKGQKLVRCRSFRAKTDGIQACQYLVSPAPSKKRSRKN